MTKIFNIKRPGSLVLEDGKIFPGELFGSVSKEMSEGVLGELVFNTALSGYQEILTDPSYLGQIVVMTYPHIGNYGINREDFESKKSYLSGFVAHEFCSHPSNWRSSQSLEDFFLEKNIPGLQGVDTRALTRHLRDKGAMNGFLLSHVPRSEKELSQWVQKIRSLPSFGERDLVSEVSCSAPYEWTSQGTEDHMAWATPIISAKDSPLVVVLDLGVKRNMLRNLVRRGVRILVVPVTTSSADILKMKPKGVLLSNGPGDPAKVAHATETVRSLLGLVPVFGICMGHQILAQAIGAKTFKMKFGHHGANQPVKDLRTGRVMITSQNHGYAVDPFSLPSYAKVAQVNLNDQSVEAIILPEKNAYSVQYHPEACPGPRDSMDFFDTFMEAMGYG